MLLEQVGEAVARVPEEPRGEHGVEDVDDDRVEIPAQVEQVAFRRVEGLLYRRIQ